MIASIDSLESQVRDQRDFETPPLHLWHPPLSGDIDIRIDASGAWYHEGEPIQRQSLVRLFASILRREEDGDYYLVTPHEKWRIDVELHPLMITDVDEEVGEECTRLYANLNTQRRIAISQENPLYVDPDAGGVAVLRLNHGLTALCTRPAWYRLVEMADTRGEEVVLRSGDFSLRLSA